VPQPGDPQNLNRFSYVLNNPIRFADSSGHCIWDLCIVEGAIIGAGVLLTVDYTVQVGKNLNAGMSFWDAVYYKNVNTQELGGATLVGTGAGATVAAIPELVGAAASTACADGDCTNEIQAITSGATNATQTAQTVIADTDVVMGKLIQPGQAAVTPSTMAELADLGRTSTAQGFGQISAEAQPGFAQAQSFFNQLVPNVQGKAGDVYNLATTAMNNGTFLTADKNTVFNPLVKAVTNGLVTGQVSANRVIIEVPQIGQVTIQLMEHK
jgi:hypothetical protein